MKFIFASFTSVVIGVAATISAAKLPPPKIEIAPQPKAEKCKKVEDKECPYCRYTFCTDGKKQWIEGGMDCSAVYCGPVKQDYNPKDWEN